MIINSQRLSFQAMALVPFQAMAMAPVQAMAMVSKIKAAKVSPDGFETPWSTVTVDLTHAMDVAELSTKTVRETIESAVLLAAGTTIAVYYKDRAGNLILVTDARAAWPVDDCVDGTIKAWYRCVPPAATLKRAATTECLGPHMHQPAGKRAKDLSEVDFDGYSMLEAARAGCAECVAFWVDSGQNANYASKTNSYTAMDFVLWAEKHHAITAEEAEAVKCVLIAADGKPNRMLAKP